VVTRIGHIAFLVDQLGDGGAPRSSLLAAGALRARGAQVTVLAAKTGSYAAELPSDLPVHLLAPKWPQSRAVATFSWKISKVAASEKIGVIVINGVTNGLSGSLIVLLMRAAGLLDVRLIVVEQTTLSVALADRFGSRAVRSAVLKLTRWLYRLADTVVGVSDGVSRDLEDALSLPSGSVMTISNPVDTKRISAAINAPVPESLESQFAGLPRPLVITVGRLVAPKAQHDLLNAFALLPESHRGSLVVLGDGPLRSQLETQAQDLEIADRIWMPGFVDNPWWFIARADVFALSSRREGHPLALLEALACGVSVAATDCPFGPAEILDEIRSARLTPVGDPIALAAAISNLLDSRIGSANSIDLRRYSPEAVAARYYGVLEKVMTEPPRNSRRTSG